MCKLVAELTSSDQRVAREMFARLERSCGDPGVDVRITSEIYGKLHMKMRALGLDPNDTTPRELYQSLLNLTALHDTFLAKRLGIVHTNNADEVSDAVIKLIDRLKIPKSAWAIKPMTIRRLLKATPPKTLMKLLSYRSLDSMLKRESPAMLLTIARHVEPSPWQVKFVNSYRKLHPLDFESRPIEVELLQEKRWQSVAKLFSKSRLSNIVNCPESGSVAILPTQISPPSGLTLTYLLVILHDINEIRAFSTYCKFQHMRPDFGDILADHILGVKRQHIMLAGQMLPWIIIHRYYGSSDRVNHPEIFEPHVQPEDLSYRKAEEVLYRLEPALHFWHDSEYVGLPRPEGPISLSLTDMAMNLVNSLPYAQRVYYHMQDALWNEVYVRYAGQSSLERQILIQLDEQSVFAGQASAVMEFAT